MSTLHDLRHGARALLRNRAFATIAIATLALGIGANTVVFSIVDAVLLRPLPFEDPERLVRLTSVRTDSRAAPFNLPDFCDYRDQNRALAGLAAIGNWSGNLTGEGEAERLQGMRASASLFSLLGVRAVAGRTLEAADDDPASPRVVAIGEGLWRRRFAADPGAVGRTLVLDGEPHTVVGVIPAELVLTAYRNAEVFVPLRPEEDPRRHIRSSTNFLRLIGRLAPGASLDLAAADLSEVAGRIRELHPVANANKLGVDVEPLHEAVVGGSRAGLGVLFGAVGLVLLVTCANLGSLLLVRTQGRAREIAVRMALGASRGRVLGQLTTESALLGLVGGALGLALAAWGLRLLVLVLPADLPRAPEIGVDLRMVAFALALALLSGLVLGLAAGWSATRPGRAALRGSTRGMIGDGQARARGALVVVEVALALVLLAGAGLLLKSFWRLQRTDPGFEPSHALVTRLSLPSSRYATVADLSTFTRRLEGELAALPGVEAVGMTSLLPMSGLLSQVQVAPAGGGLDEKELPWAHYRAASPELLAAMRIPLLEGRGFEARDDATARPVALVNETLARRLWPSGGAVGSVLQVDDADAGPRGLEVVGVVGDFQHEGLDAPPAAGVMIPVAQVIPDGLPWVTASQFWIVRTTGDPAGRVGEVRRAIATIDPEVPSAATRPLGDYLTASLAPRVFALRLLAGFAAFALLLAALGIYGVIAHTVGQRTREIGLRMALGARRGEVFGLVLGRGMALAAIGIGLGLVLAWGLTRFARSLLFEVSATDLATYAAVVAVLGTATFVACYLPARRAARLDPVVALRDE